MSRIYEFDAEIRKNPHMDAAYVEEETLQRCRRRVIAGTLKRGRK